MRAEIIASLRRLGKAAGMHTSVLNADVPMKWVNDNIECLYAFQIGDLVTVEYIRKLYECIAQHKIYFVIAMDKPFMLAAVKKIADKYPGIDTAIRFVSVKEMRNTLDDDLAKEIFGTAVYHSEEKPVYAETGAVLDLDARVGIALSKIGSEAGYSVRSPEPGHYIWYRKDGVSMVLEAVVGKGFAHPGIKLLNESKAGKTLYISTSLYGDLLQKVKDKMLKTYPTTMIEFMGVADVQTPKELEDLIRRRTVEDLKTAIEAENLKADKHIWNW